MVKFSDESIQNFLDELSSDLPAPGGGAVAGLVSAISAALNSMVYSLTVGKKKYLSLSEEEKDMIIEFQRKSREFMLRSLELMEDDRSSFMMLMDCYKLPKETELEKEKRENAINENTIKAMEVPLLLARESFDFYENLSVMAKYGNKMLLSDLSISAILLHSAIESSIVNVKVNLNSLRHEEFFNEIDTELKELIKKSQIEKDKICNYVESVIYIN